MQRKHYRSIATIFTECYLFPDLYDQKTLDSILEKFITWLKNSEPSFDEYKFRGYITESVERIKNG